MVDRLLLGLAFIDEVLGDPIRLGNLAHQYGKLGFWVPRNYQGGPFKQLLYRMLKTGSIEKRVTNGEPELILTGSGRKLVERKFSMFKQQQKHWDGYWRLIIFDIPEKERGKRQRLRNKLLELGFGMWQKSIYLSPFDWEEDMVEFLQAEKFLGQAWVLTAKHKLLGEAKDLAASVWRLNQLNDEYGSLSERLMGGREPLNKICYDYSVLLANDPCLPRELLPGGWAAFKVRQLIKDVTNKYPIG